MSRQSIIEARLREALSPTALEITNESGMHAVAPGSETHFKVVVASAAFEGRSRVERHRAVHRLLEAELAQGLHALSVSAFTPEEWEARPVLASPACLGGSKADRPAGGGWT